MEKLNLSLFIVISITLVVVGCKNNQLKYENTELNKHNQLMASNGK